MMGVPGEVERLAHPVLDVAPEVVVDERRVVREEGEARRRRARLRDVVDPQRLLPLLTV